MSDRDQGEDEKDTIPFACSVRFRPGGVLLLGCRHRPGRVYDPEAQQLAYTTLEGLFPDKLVLFRPVWIRSSGVPISWTGISGPH
ncbi:MAG TPA: hypothetical protein VGK70_13015 [Thermoanaerobaculia bacterium]